MARLGFLTRLQLVGLSSLAALFVGGTMLILIGINTTVSPSLSQDTSWLEGASTNGNERRFRYGSSQTVQTWTAIIGIAFSLLAYGFAETYIHLFDDWCTRRARHLDGLDYGRYLNSQPRAAVNYGLRGFPVFVTLRYLFAMSTIAASVLYKFAIIQPDVLSHENLDARQIELSPSPLQALNNSVPSPWFIDVPQGLNNRAFFHVVQAKHGYNEDLSESNWDPMQPPTSIAMVGWAHCPGVFHPHDIGYILSKEIVMLSNMTEGDGDSVMTANSTGWMRAQTSNKEWFDPKAQAVVDYRVLKPGSIQIRWAKAGTWMEDETQSVRAARVLTYTMRYAVAIVARWVRHGECSFLPEMGGGVDSFLITAMDNTTVITQDDEATLPYYRNWVDALLGSLDTLPLQGVSTFNRAVMAGWAAVNRNGTTGPNLRHVPTDRKPFGPESYGAKYMTGYIGVQEGESEDAKFPFFDGVRSSDATGCYVGAARAFMALGIFSILVAIVRIWQGPPALTSWMGQHIHLAQAGAITVYGKADELATGYVAAGQGVGRLRLPPKGHSALRADDQGFEMDFGDGMIRPLNNNNTMPT